VLIRDRSSLTKSFCVALILERSGSPPICAKWLFTEIEGLQEAGDQLVEASEEEEDLQLALEDEGEGEAAYEVEEGSPYLTVLELLKRRRSKQLLNLEMNLLNL
jgi:hypothetical protein